MPWEFGTFILDYQFLKGSCRKLHTSHFFFMWTCNADGLRALSKMIIKSNAWHHEWQNGPQNFAKLYIHGQCKTSKYVWRCMYLILHYLINYSHKTFYVTRLECCTRHWSNKSDNVYIKTPSTVLISIGLQYLIVRLSVCFPFFLVKNKKKQNTHTAKRTTNRKYTFNKNRSHQDKSPPKWLLLWPNCIRKEGQTLTLVCGLVSPRTREAEVPHVFLGVQAACVRRHSPVYSVLSWWLLQFHFSRFCKSLPSLAQRRSPPSINMERNNSLNSAAPVGGGGDHGT